MAALAGVNFYRLANLLGKGLLISTLLGLFFATRLYLIRDRIDHQPITFWMAARFNVVTWYLWAVTACFVVWFARRVPIEQNNWRSRLLIHGLASVVVALVHIAMFSVWYWAIEVPNRDTRSWWAMYKLHLLISFHWDVLIYAGVLAVTKALDLERRARDRDVRASQLETQLSKAQLSALRMQLNPHFLFNSLNALTTLVHEDPMAAEGVIVRLSQLLRTTLEQADLHEIPLADELDFVRKYLDIDRIRFGDRLALEWKVDPQTLQALVPSLLLQPLIENAVRHGIGRHAGDCRITITANRFNDTLRLEVHDAAATPRQDSMKSTGRGVGLSNTRERLAHLYGPQGRLEIIHPEEGGWTTRVEMPLRFAPAPLGKEAAPRG